jgi:flagellar protein FlgJ
MRDLRSTYPFFFVRTFAMFFIAAVFSLHAAAQDLSISKQLKMSADQTRTQARMNAEANPELTPVSKVEKPTPVVRDKRVLDAAKMYEKYFLGQMMKAMRSTVAKSDLEKTSMGEGIYRDQLDDQYVDSWGERGGIGLADMIHDELVGKAEMAKMRRKAMKAAHGKVRTPMALTDRDVIKVRTLPSVKAAGDPASGEKPAEMIQTVLVTLDKTTARPGDTPESVRSPWAAKVTGIRDDAGKVILRMETIPTEKEPSRKIELAFDGVPFEVTEGAVVQAGQTVGQLAKAARGILLRQTLVQGAIKPRLEAGLAIGSEPSLEAAPGAGLAPNQDEKSD